MDVVLPDVKPALEELSPSASGAVDENSGTGGQGSLAKGPPSNNNTIKALSVQQAKALQQQSQISTSSGSGGGTVYINSASGALLSSSGGPPPSVRTSILTTTTSSSTVAKQQLQTMAKSAGLNIVHVTVPQSVIQSPSSVIQSASGQIQLSKGNVILVSSKAPSGVIQATSGALQAVQLLESQQQQLNSDESLSNDDHPSNRGGGGADRKRRDILTRRPSYRKILNDLGGAEITGERGDSTATTSESSQDGIEEEHGSSIIIGGTPYPGSVVKVLNANALGLSGASTADTAASLQTITMTNAGTGGTIVQYAHPDGQPFYVPGNHWTGSPVSGDLQAYTIRPMSSANSNTPTVVVHGGGGHQQHHPPEEQTRKREIRLLKNREAARECRRKKKEYIKCLENRVAVLENQNKALIDELKSLKELYCQQKVE